MKKILSFSMTLVLVFAFAIPQASFAMSTFDGGTQTEVKSTSVSALQSQIAALTAQLETLKAMLSKQKESMRPNTSTTYYPAKPLVAQPVKTYGCGPGEKFDIRSGERCANYVIQSDIKPTLTTAPKVNADVTGNGIVNIDDLLAVISHWGACPVIDPAIDQVARYAACTSDIDHDGMVGQSDMKLVQANWTK